MSQREEWSQSRARLLLRRVRRELGQTQAECAEELRDLGASAVQQSDVSNWERARTGPEPGNRAAIERYCATALDDKPATEPPQSDTEQDAAPRSAADNDAFDHAIASLSGSPALSGRQAALLDALIERLRTGPPLSGEDEAAVRFVADVLRLDVNIDS